MDSSNIHYNKSHKVVVCSSSSSSALLHDDSNYNYSSSAAGNPPPPLHVSWNNTSNSFLSDVSIASAVSDEALMNLRNTRLYQNENLVTSLNNPSIMTKDFGLESSCGGGGVGNFVQNHEDHHNHQLLQLNSQIKQEASYSNLYGRFFSDKNINENNNNNNGIIIMNQSSSSLEESSNSSVITTSRSSSQIYPTINVSEFLNNQHHQPGGGGGGSMGLNYSSGCGGFGMNLQGLDLFNSGRGFGGGSFHQPFQVEEFEFSKNHMPCYGMDFIKQSLENTFESGGCNISHDGKMEFLNKRVAELKKNEVINSEPKTGNNNKTQAGKKRSRSVESRASPPLKVFQVRKEKLGDRVAALQQLVAPFGKTDTASVLMEAIGYIKFLQNQVETLSVPYLKSSRHKNNKAAQHGGYVDNKSEEQSHDLRSKGLCLVPLSCLSYVTDGNGAMWPPPHFG